MFFHDWNTHTAPPPPPLSLSLKSAGVGHFTHPSLLTT